MLQCMFLNFFLVENLIKLKTFYFHLNGSSFNHTGVVLVHPEVQVAHSRFIRLFPAQAGKAKCQTGVSCGQIEQATDDMLLVSGSEIPSLSTSARGREPSGVNPSSGLSRMPKEAGRVPVPFPR